MTKQPGTLYTFGCSITSYSWPTWADILGKNFSRHENWGRPHAGNEFIFHSIIECLEKNTITHDDTIIIMWSGITRHDYYQINQWNHSTIEPTISVNEEKFESCPDGLEIINYSYFSAIDRLLSSLGLNYQMLTWNDYDCDTRAGLFYNNVLNKITKVNYSFNEHTVIKIAEESVKRLYNRVAGSEWPAFQEIFTYNPIKYNPVVNQEVENFKEVLKENRHLYYTEITSDAHPTPLEHLQIVRQIFPDYPISDNTVAWITDIDEKIVNNQEYVFDKKTIERL